MSLTEQFLTSIRGLVLDQNGGELRNWLQVQNDVADVYHQLGNELKTSFPDNTDALEKLVDQCLPEEDDVPEGKGSPWPGFNSFIRDYLGYWRDVDFADLIKLYSQLSELVNSCANAFANPTYGVMLLQTSMSLSQSLSSLVMSIHRQPELSLQLMEDFSFMPDEDGEERKSFIELAADIIQKFFASCLTDRSSEKFASPRGKKLGVYLFANLTLKLLFACEKSKIAVQMFTNLTAGGPALSVFPASQRVTFLYYLGRFYYEHREYWRAHLAFEAAYKQCHPSFLKHRRQILAYWIPINLLLARFPSPNLLQRPEAVGFAEVYLPICAAIRTGNFVHYLEAFRLNKDSLLERNVYTTLILTLRSLVWRSLTRKIFMLKSELSPVPADGVNSQAVPQLYFDDVVTVATYVQKLLEGYTPAPRQQSQQTLPQAPIKPKRPPHINTLFMKAVSNSAAENTASETFSSFPALIPPPGGPRELMPFDGLICGNLQPNALNMESMLASLVMGGYLNGFISQQHQSFGIEGAKKSGDPVRAGWPNPWQSIMDRFQWGIQRAQAKLASGETLDRPSGFYEVPGWVKNVGEGPD